MNTQTMAQARTMATDMPAYREVYGVNINADLTKGPYHIDGRDTLPKLWMDRCKELGETTAHREKDYGIWLSFSWNDFYNASRLIGLGLHRLGLKRGEAVSILSEDKKEWLYVDMGILGMGGICSGVYTTDSAAQLTYLVNDSDSRFLFLENDEQLDKYLEVKKDMPGLTKAIIFDDDGLHDFSDPDVIFLQDLYDLGREQLKETPDLFEAEIEKANPNDTSILIYTSGTTGMPKGAMVSHGNLMFSLSSALSMTPTYASDDIVCFLPLCHVLERLFSGYAPLVTRSTVNFAESPETVFDNIQEVSPQTFVAVPRLWEKIYSRVAILTQDATSIQRWAYRSAVRAGEKIVALEEAGKPVPATTRAVYKMWDALVLKNLRRMLGMDRMRRGGSGAAPISPELIRWFHAIGVPVLEGYGMTESGGVISINTHENNKFGTVGKVIDGGQVRIADGGEIQYYGANVFQGYLNNNEKTAETFTADGWLRTGDVGSIDEDGYLTITGRLKDIIITAGGKNITPAEIENRLKFSPFISDAVIIGDKRKFLTCLIMIDQENVEKFAQDRRVPFNNFASLCAAPEVQKLIGEVVEDVNKNFARVEQIKEFRLIDVLLTAEDDELTPTMKLKRSFVEQKHAALIADMY
jgi:long-chain acyl-CoA synthetase